MAQIGSSTPVDFTFVLLLEMDSMIFSAVAKSCHEGPKMSRQRWNLCSGNSKDLWEEKQKSYIVDIYTVHAYKYMLYLRVW